jgi:hypothetical protein
MTDVAALLSQAIPGGLAGLVLIGEFVGTPAVGLPSPADQPTVTSTILFFAGQAGSYLTTTAWQRLGNVRTLLSNLAWVVSDYSDVELFETECGYLDACSALLDSGGNPITVPLDTLALEVYNVQRSPATYAAGLVPLINTGAPFVAQPLTLMLVSTITGATYTNLVALTIPSGTSLQAFVATSIGSASSAAAGTILVPSPPLAGLSCGPLAADMVGADAGSNASLLASAQAQLVPVSPQGASQVWITLARQTDPLITRAFAQTFPKKGKVNVYLAQTFAPATSAQVTAVTAAYDEGAVAGGVELGVFPAGVQVVTLTGFIFVPAGSPVTAASLKTLVTESVALYYATLPIGGVEAPSGSVLPASGTLAAVVAATSKAVGPSYAPSIIVELFLNGLKNTDVPVTATQIGQVVNLMAVIFL